MANYAMRLIHVTDKHDPYNQSFGQRKVTLPEHVVEEMYQQKLLGGFSKKRLCAKCRTALPLTNICDYCE